MRRSRWAQIVLLRVYCQFFGKDWEERALSRGGGTSACDDIIIRMEKYPHPSTYHRGNHKERLPILQHPRTPGRIEKNKENPMRQSLAQSTKRTPNAENTPIQNLEFRQKGSPQASKTLLCKQGVKGSTEGKNPWAIFQGERHFERQEENLPSYTFQKISPSNIKTHSQTPIPKTYTATPFKMYSPNKMPLSSSKKPLPGLQRDKSAPKQAQDSPDKKEDIRPSDFGAYAEKKSIEAFLKRFKQALQKNFIQGPNVECEDELYKVQFYLLREIHSEGKWLD